MRRFRWLVLTLVLGFLGCEDSPYNPNVKPTPTQPVIVTTGNRFQPTSVLGIALDTKTGLLCGTYSVDRNPYKVYPGNYKTGIVGSVPTYTNIPNCVDLSQNEKATVASEIKANTDAKANADTIKAMDAELKEAKKTLQGRGSH